MWFKKYWWIISCSLFTFGLKAQDTEYRYAFFFKDKGGAHASFSLQQPQQFLSERALERRAKFAISLHETDLPVHRAYVKQILDSLPGAWYVGSSKWLNVAILGSNTPIAQLPAFSFVENWRSIYQGPAIWKGLPATPGLPCCGTMSLPPYQGDFFQANVQNEMIGGDYLHGKGWNGRNVIVAILDAGFQKADVNPAFQHLFADGRVLNTWDFVAGEPGVYEDNSHGALVFSAMAGYLPNAYVGLAPAASYVLLRTENAPNETISEEFYWVMGAEYADSVGADVLNSSLGYTTFDQAEDSHVYGTLDGRTATATLGAVWAARKGLMVINSAGNSGSQSWRYIGVPADADSILAIGAVDAERQKASFSSFGPSADNRVKPDVAAMGRQTVLVGVQGAVTTANGTSFSAPIVAAAVALLRQAFPDRSPQTILQAVRGSADHFTQPGDGLGYGIPHLGMASFLLQATAADSALFMLYPNPGKTPEVKAEFFVPSAGDYALTVFNTQGQRIMEWTWTFQSRGLYVKPLTLPSQAKGVLEWLFQGPGVQRRMKWLGLPE